MSEKLNQFQKCFLKSNSSKLFSGDVKKHTGELKMLNSSFIAGHIFYTTLSSFLSENSSNYFIKICGVNKEGKKEITLNLVYFIFVLYYWSNVSVSRRFILSKIHPKLMHQHHSFLHFLPSSAVCSLCMAGSWGL